MSVFEAIGARAAPCRASPACRRAGAPRLDRQGGQGSRGRRASACRRRSAACQTKSRALRRTRMFADCTATSPSCVPPARGSTACCRRRYASPTGRNRCASTSAASGDASSDSPRVRGRSSSVHGRARSDSSCSIGSPLSPGRCAKPRSTRLASSSSLVEARRPGTRTWVGATWTCSKRSRPRNSAAAPKRRRNSTASGAFDREILRRVIEAEKLERPALLHPGLMYRAFRPFWHQETTVHRVDDYARYERLQVAPEPGAGRPAPARLRRRAVLLQLVVPGHARESRLRRVTGARSSPRRRMW